MRGSRSRDFDWINRCNLVLLVLLVLVGLLFGRLRIVSGLMMGGMISLLNFRLLARIVSGAILPGSNKLLFAAKIMIKFLGLMAAVAASLFWAPVDSVAFVIGISITFISLGINGLVHVFRTEAMSSESTDA